MNVSQVALGYLHWINGLSFAIAVFSLFCFNSCSDPGIDKFIRWINGVSLGVCVCTLIILLNVPSVK